jgi:hypothetical protein
MHFYMYYNLMGGPPLPPTFSLWTDLRCSVERERPALAAGRLDAVALLNPFYAPTDAPLRPSSNSKHFVLWPYFLRCECLCMAARRRLCRVLTGNGAFSHQWRPLIQDSPYLGDGGILY